MSVAATDIIYYLAKNSAGAAAGPCTDDTTSTPGGDIDTTRKVVFTQMASSGVSSIIRAASNGVSDGAKTLTITGRDTTGAVITDTVTISATANSYVAGAGSKQFERIQKCELSAAAVGTITVTDSAGSPGAGLPGTNTLGTIEATLLGFYMLFENAASDPSVTKTRYELFYAKNTNASFALTTANVQLSADPSAKLTVALASAKGSWGTPLANRLTVPGSTSAYSGVAVNIPVPGAGQQLAAGEYIGVWLKQSLGIGDAPQKNPWTAQVTGFTT